MIEPQQQPTPKKTDEIQWEAKIEHAEMAALLEILEDMEDEVAAIKLLQDFNRKNSRFGEMVKKRSEFSQEEFEEAYHALRDVVTTILKLGGNPLLA